MSPRGKSHPAVSLVSLGCPKNLVDSEKMLSLLAEGGCLVGAPMEEADVIVVNTCGFLSAARDESLEVIGEAVKHKRRGRASRVVVAGCLVNRDARKLYRLAPGIDAIVGVNDRDGLLSAVTGKGTVTRITPNLPQGHVRVGHAGSSEHAQPRAGSSPSTDLIASDAGRFRLTARHTAYLRISEGCSQRCTFCTIPAIRGPFRSKGPQAVLEEARELIADGAVELNVIGQDTTSYGMDLPGAGPRRASLAKLMDVLGGLDGLKWLRLMYAYPIRFTDALIDTIAGGGAVVPYADLPLQHISDPVLKAMGRRVTRARTEALLDKMRRRIPGLVLRTTFIVGFPGETDGRFEELLQFVKDFKFDALGVFEFSPEEGTAAGSLPGGASGAVKARRARQIMLAQREIAFAASRRRIGDRIRVLVDGTDSRGRCVGRHYGQAPDIDSICILTQRRRGGTFVWGKVVDCVQYDLIVQPG